MKNETTDSLPAFQPITHQQRIDLLAQLNRSLELLPPRPPFIAAASSSRSVPEPDLMAREAVCRAMRDLLTTSYKIET